MWQIQHPLSLMYFLTFFRFPCSFVVGPWLVLTNELEADVLVPLADTNNKNPSAISFILSWQRVLDGIVP